MSIDSKIEWTDHTLNLWWGCEKVSAGCKFCYAERLDNRYNNENPHWGPGSERKEVKSWEKTLRKIFNIADNAARPQRVFVGSMMDIMEDPKPVNGHWKTTGMIREDFLNISMSGSKNIIYLLLTKRPSNYRKYLPLYINFWLGCSITCQDDMNNLDMMMDLAEMGYNTFISFEPLLGPLDFEGRDIRRIRWAIFGGESGPKARPMHPDWATAAIDYFRSAGVPTFFKQYGEWAPDQREWRGETQECKPTRGTFDKDGKFHRGKLIAGGAVMQKIGKTKSQFLIDTTNAQECPPEFFGEPIKLPF